MCILDARPHRWCAPAPRLAGTLEVKLISNFRPSKGDRFTIITCTTRNGEFDALILPTAPTVKGATWRVEYHPDHVDLVFDG